MIYFFLLGNIKYFSYIHWVDCCQNIHKWMGHNLLKLDTETTNAFGSKKNYKTTN